VRLPRGLEAECRTCGTFFTGEAAFDRHLLRTGCQPPGDVRGKDGEPVLFCHQRGRGPTWSMTPEGDETPRSAAFSGRSGAGPGVAS
jgi:hypothetical protein